MTFDTRTGPFSINCPEPYCMSRVGEPCPIPASVPAHASRILRAAEIDNRRLIVDPWKCGAGQGERCCAWLVGSVNGPECGRVDPELSVMLRRRAEAGLMNARRLPSADYPGCQLKTDA